MRFFSLWDVAAGPGTSAYISSACWWWWPCPSNRDASRPKSRGTASRTTGRSSTARTTTATKKTRPHEALDSDTQSPFSVRNTRDKLKTTESWRRGESYSPDREPNIGCSENSNRQKNTSRLSVKTSSSRDDSNHSFQRG